MLSSTNTEMSSSLDMGVTVDEFLEDNDTNCDIVLNPNMTETIQVKKRSVMEEDYKLVDKLGVMSDQEKLETNVIKPTRTSDSLLPPSVQRLPNSIENEADDIPCLLCDVRVKDYSILVAHLSCTHYKQELYNLFDEGGHKLFCPICGKMFDKEERTTGLIMHLGSDHQHVVNVADKEVKEQLNELRAFHQPINYNEELWYRCKKRFSSDRIGWTCCPHFTSGPQALRYHIASVHYSCNLVMAYGSVGTPCKHCKPGKEYIAKSKTDIVLHHITSHPRLLYNLMSVQDATLLSDCFSLEKNNLITLPNGYSCFICNLAFDRPSWLKRHLCTVHYASEILQAAKAGGDSRICPICRQTLGIPPNTDIIKHMSFHIGCKHGYLEKVLPENVINDLDIIEKRKAQINENGGEKEYKLKNGKKPMVCPTCGKDFWTALDLRSHLATRHFRRDILKLVTLPHNYTCPLCEKLVADFTVHMGVKHKYLDRVIPTEMKRELNKMLELKTPKAARFEVPKLITAESLKAYIADDHNYCRVTFCHEIKIEIDTEEVDPLKV